jgi:hypothetical protein
MLVISVFFVLIQDARLAPLQEMEAVLLVRKAGSSAMEDAPNVLKDALLAPQQLPALFAVALITTEMVPHVLPAPTLQPVRHAKQTQSQTQLSVLLVK